MEESSFDLDSVPFNSALKEEERVRDGVQVEMDEDNVTVKVTIMTVIQWLSETISFLFDSFQASRSRK